MFCGKCGMENADGAKFCKSCGNPLGAADSQQKKAENQREQKVIVSTTPNVLDKIKSVPKNILLGVVGAVVALIIIICIASGSGKTINLNKYLTVETSGYDGFGRATVSVDWDAIEEKYGSKLKFTSLAKKAMNEYGDMFTPMELVRECVYVRLDTNSGLSNGDTVTYTWDVDDELSQYVKCKIKYKDGELKVSDLTEVETFDAFADLTVEFSGISPNGSLNMDYTGTELSRYDFYCDTTSGLSNGDTVTITINSSNVDYCAENYGKVPAEMEKQYTVEGLTSYLTSLNQIDEAAMTEMQKQATDVYYAWVARDWDEGSALMSFDYIGDYLLTAKDSSTWGTHNAVYLVYKVQTQNDYSNEEESFSQLNSHYWYIEFDDLMVSSEGSVEVDVNSYDTPRDQFVVDSGIDSGWWNTKSWYYYGYGTLDELYKNVVTKHMDSYNYEDNVVDSAN